MHVWTLLKTASRARPARRVSDGMVDTTVSRTAARQARGVGIADNTIVMYSTDNGAEELSWPTAGPRRSAREGYNWTAAGACRPRSGGRASSSRHGLQRDLLAPGHAPHAPRAAGEPDISRSAKKATRPEQTFKVYLDGFNLLPHFKGEVKRARARLPLWSDDGDLMRPLRQLENSLCGAARGGSRHGRSHRLVEVPDACQLATDPFENAEVSATMSTQNAGGRIFMLAPAVRARRPVHPDDGEFRTAIAGELDRRRRDGEAPGAPGGAGIRLGRRREVARSALNSMAAGAGDNLSALPFSCCCKVITGERAVSGSDDVRILRTDPYRLHCQPPRRSNLTGIQLAAALFIVLANRDAAPNQAILIAGCGTSQAAATLCGEPEARVTRSTSARQACGTPAISNASTTSTTSNFIDPIERVRELGARSPDRVTECSTIYRTRTPVFVPFVTCSIHRARCTSWCMRRTAAPAST